MKIIENYIEKSKTLEVKGISGKRDVYRKVIVGKRAIIEPGDDETKAYVELSENIDECITFEFQKIKQQLFKITDVKK
jgi:hypothetical protein